MSPLLDKYDKCLRLLLSVFAKCLAKYTSISLTRNFEGHGYKLITLDGAYVANCLKPNMESGFYYPPPFNSATKTTNMEKFNHLENEVQLLALSKNG